VHGSTSPGGRPGGQSGAVPVQPLPGRGGEDGSFAALADGEVDRPGRPRASGIAAFLPPLRVSRRRTESVRCFVGSAGVLREEDGPQRVPAWRRRSRRLGLSGQRCDMDRCQVLDHAVGLAERAALIGELGGLSRRQGVAPRLGGMSGGRETM
jgi:hypothetical protein